MLELNEKYNVPIEWTYFLQDLQIKIGNASGACLNKSEIIGLNNLAFQLIKANPETAEQLRKFWGIYLESYNILRSNPKIGSYTPLGIIGPDWTRIVEADKLAGNLVAEASNDNPTTFSFPLALLLAHVVRVETIGYAIWKQLKDVVSHFENYGLSYTMADVEFMGSVHTTVVKGNAKKEIRSDAKAIRDSIAHGHFSFKKTADGYEIEFKNDDYPFHQVFTKLELQKFFDLYTMLYRRQLLLLFIIELIPHLTTYFIKES